MKKTVASLFILLTLLMMGAASAQDSPARVTIFYDAFGKPSTLKRGWGYSALIEYGGKRVLFDTGSDKDDFAHNVKTLGVDLTRLDFVVLSHRHGDHTSGLNYVLSVNRRQDLHSCRRRGVWHPNRSKIAQAHSAQCGHRP